MLYEAVNVPAGNMLSEGGRGARGAFLCLNRADSQYGGFLSVRTKKKTIT